MQIWAVRSVKGPKDSVSNPSLALLAEHGFDDMGDGRQLEGFAQERGIQAARGFGDSAFGERAHDHGRDIVISRIFLHGLEHCRPIHYRHHEVEQDEVGPPFTEELQPLPALIAVTTSWPASANTDCRTSATLNSSSTTRMSATLILTAMPG